MYRLQTQNHMSIIQYVQQLGMQLCEWKHFYKDWINLNTDRQMLSYSEEHNRHMNKIHSQESSQSFGKSWVELRKMNHSAKYNLLFIKKNCL